MAKGSKTTPQTLARDLDKATSTSQVKLVEAKAEALAKVQSLKK